MSSDIYWLIEVNLYTYYGHLEKIFPSSLNFSPILPCFFVVIRVFFTPNFPFFFPFPSSFHLFFPLLPFPSLLPQNSSMFFNFPKVPGHYPPPPKYISIDGPERQLQGVHPALPGRVGGSPEYQVRGRQGLHHSSQVLALDK